jgi:hypothetical protein
MIRRNVMFSLLLFIALGGVSSYGRSILEKRIYYVDNNGKAGEARFWSIFLGNHDCKIVRRQPGEAEKEIVASMNLQFLSSGYIEGNGFGETGKVQSLPTMEIAIGGNHERISIDSIDFIYDYGTRVQLIDGKKGDFIINVESDRKVARQFLMRQFSLTNYFGEEILKEGSQEIYLSVIAFSKEGLARARKAQQEVEKSQ